jgi:hypothetical protein
MPSNGPAEKVLYGLKGIPLFTYGMIGITTLVLAYITFTDVDIENPLDTINPVSELQKDPTSEEPAANGEPGTSEVPVADPTPTVADADAASIAPDADAASITADADAASITADAESVVAVANAIPDANTTPDANATPDAVATPVTQEPTAPPLEKIDEDENEKPKEKGGKKRTIRHKQKHRRTIRK